MRLGTAIERLFDNYVYASDKEWIRDKVSWALYQTWREADARKTEPSSSEKPNNCETCRYGQDKHRYAHICNECGVGINNYEPKTEPTGYNLSPVKDEPQTMTIFQLIQNYLDKKLMPQRIKYEMMQDGYEYFRWSDDADEYINENDSNCILRETPWHHLLDEVEIMDEPQTDIHDLTDCDFCKDRNCKDCEGGKDEPQTDCSWK